MKHDNRGVVYLSHHNYIQLYHMQWHSLNADLYCFYLDTELLEFFTWFSREHSQTGACVLVPQIQDMTQISDLTEYKQQQPSQ